MYKDSKEPLPFIRSPFTLKELEQAEKWEEFCAFLQKKGDPFAAFLSTVPRVEWKDSRLTLYTSHAFYRDWVLEESNYRKMCIRDRRRTPVSITPMIRECMR